MNCLKNEKKKRIVIAPDEVSQSLFYIFNSAETCCYVNLLIFTYCFYSSQQPLLFYSSSATGYY